MTQNRLTETTSPYLLQHVDNPVAWHPWDSQALALAAQQNKPILLSIGYSACHWCHVMAHESFEDPATAAVMNEHFVNIKVDREERPDLDQIYQLAHQMLTQRGGGWPLTMFLTPDQHIPFFGGTYFPPKADQGLPGFVELLGRVSEFYRLHQDKIEEQSTSIQQVFRDSLPQAGHNDVELDAAPLHGASRALLGVFDPAWGGFGGAPKFPQTPSIERLLRTWRRSAFDAQPDLQSLFGATQSLQHMARSGLFDQVGGGFYRYCVDHNWRIPHFEKMMYDNAQLLALYSEAWRATGDGLFGRTAHATADWMLREMRSPENGFYTALDADSEGHEGKYYVWTPDEVRELVGEEHFPMIAARWGLDLDANFEGQWHLYNAKSVADIATEFDIEINELQDHLGAAQTALYSHRETRVRPHCDTKCLTSSNALAIRGLALAARHLERDDLLDAAEDTLQFIMDNLWVDGRLRTTFSKGKATLNAYLHDYAFLLDAILELLQTRWNSEFLTFAQQLAELLLEQFYDAQDGGFFFTSDDHETLLQRMKPLTDDASPGANGVAARALNRLGHLLGEPRYLDASRRTLELAWPALNSTPHGHCALLDALEEQLEHITCVVIRAPQAEISQWLPIANATYAPGRLSVAIPDEAIDLPEALAIRAPREGGVAYICHGTECSAPITSTAQLSSEIKSLN